MAEAELRCATWNIAAINNNPFEYYLTLEREEGYARLMVAIEQLIDNPGDQDVKVSTVFPQAMFERLVVAMGELGWEGVDQVKDIWLNDYSQRTIVSGFLKDGDLGSKRIVSMADRITNTINAEGGVVLCRPSVINNYQGDISDLDTWFDAWLKFMFSTEVSVKNKKSVVETKRVVGMLQPIQRAKYPAVTEEEEAISLPLQLMALAIFDALLLHIMRTCAGDCDWHALKLRICDSLVVNKQVNVLKILARAEYLCSDVIFLQEVAGAFVDLLRSSSELADRFEVLVPSAVDHVRDQNSVILVAKKRIGDGGASEVHVELGKDVSVADGDLCVFRVPLRFGAGGQPVLLASFHGDTAGLSSTPAVNAVRAAASAVGVPAVIGLDANTHALEHPKGATRHVGAFLADLRGGGHSLRHTWPGDDTRMWHTTFNARTYLQPQLNKAVRYGERHSSRLTDCNPKDFILFSEGAFEVAGVAQRDNTGECKFVEGTDMPSLTFPSDHALVASVLRATAPL